MSDPIRRVLVPDLAFEEATVTSNSQQGRRAPMSSVASHNGSLVVPGFPSVEDDEHGDGRPRFSGTPTDDESYFADLTHTGVVGTSRFALVSPNTAWAPKTIATSRKVKQSPLIAGQRVDCLESYYDDPDSANDYHAFRPKAVYTGEKVVVISPLTKHSPYDRYTKNPTSGALAPRSGETLNAVWVHRKNVSDQNWEFSDVVYLPSYGGIFDPVGVIGVEYFADVDQLVLVVVYGSLTLQGSVVTYVSEDLGETWYVGHVASVARGNDFDIKRGYEDTVKYQYQNTLADDGDYAGVIEFSDQYEGYDAATYDVYVIKPGAVGLPETPEEDCARVAWSLDGTFLSPLNNTSRFGKGGRSSHLGSGVYVHTPQSVEGYLVVIATFDVGDYVAFKYEAPGGVAPHWVISTPDSSADATALALWESYANVTFDENNRDGYVPANGDLLYVTFLEKGWPGFIYKGLGLKFASQLVTAASGGSYVAPVSPSSLDAGVPVRSGQAILLSDNTTTPATDLGVSVTFYHDERGNELDINQKFSCFYDPRSFFHDLDVVRLSNDRLVALVVTSTSCFSLFSDDRGGSWSNTTILQFGENVYAAGGSITRLPNGTLVAVVSPTLGWRGGPDFDTDGLRLSAPETQELTSYMFLSKDGETWTGPVLLSSFDFGNAIERRVVVRPDGWPMLLSQQHYHYNSTAIIDPKNTAASNDAIHERVFAVREVTGNETLEQIFPSHMRVQKDVLGSSAGAEHWPFLWGNQGQVRGYQEGIYPVAYSGHAHGIAAVCYYGRLEVISPYVICVESATNYPTFEPKGSYVETLESIQESTVRVYNTNYWSSVVEDLSMCQENDVSAYYKTGWGGRSYQLQWNAGVNPENEDWDPGSGAGTHTIVFADDDNRGGYNSLVMGSSDSRIYSLETLPNGSGGDAQASTGWRSSVRVIFKPVSGGSATWATKDDRITAGLILKDPDGERPAEHIHWELRSEVDGGTGALTVKLFDALAGTQIGSSYTATAGFEWLEVLVATTQEGVDPGTFEDVVVCFAAIRELDHSEYETDFSWISQTGEVLTRSSSVATEQIYWGCEAPSGEATSALWKAVHMHRGHRGGFLLPNYAGGSGTYLPPLRLHTVFQPTDDTGFTSFLSLPGATLSDAGLNNPPLPPRTTRSPQYLRKGLSVAWEGNSQARLSWPVAPEYQYPADSSNHQPVQRRYRSELQDTWVGLGPNQEYVSFDNAHAGGLSAEGICIFGNNFPQLLVELSDASDFSTGISYRIGASVGFEDVEYDCTLWSGLGTNFDSSGVSTITHDGNTMTVAMVGAASPGWRPHQFYSTEGGQQFYLAVRDPNAPEHVRVVRILDNTENALILEGTSSVMDDSISTPSIKMFIYSDRFAADTGLSGRYRYARISAKISDQESPFTEWPVVFYPSTKRYWELGRVMLGRWFDINNPYVEWGWSYSHDSGYKLTDTPSKARFSKRESTLTRKVTASFDFLHWDVRTDSTRAVDAERTDSTRAVDAERSWQHMIDLLRRLEIDGRPCALVWEATDNDGSFTNGDPFEVLCVRADIGDSTHTMYNNRVGSNDVCTPKPVMSLSGLTFTEED